MTFHNQVSLKSHDICNQKVILRTIDTNEPLSIANTIGKEPKILPVFPWLITLRTDLQGRKIIAGINFPHKREAFVGSGGRKSAVSVEL